MCGIESIQSRITPSLDTGRKELFLNVIDSTITKWQHRMCNFFKLAMKMDVHNISRTKQQCNISLGNERSGNTYNCRQEANIMII